MSLHSQRVSVADESHKISELAGGAEAARSGEVAREKARERL
jgi:hypothetical protein